MIEVGFRERERVNINFWCYVLVGSDHSERERVTIMFSLVLHTGFYVVSDHCRKK